ncbi:hypothetical protein [Aestuariivirga sp.]|uniref:hypothetical protein n=1 Tax=Aestuariivirga sp. TaxID=2650926 RepID=UPI0039E39305
MTEAAIPILYIVSHPRSGSTLVGSVLGLADGHVYVGEVRDVWRDGLLRNENCGCGQPFRDCPFWTQVFQRAFGGFDTEPAKQAAQTFSRLDHRREMLRLLPTAFFFPTRKRLDGAYAAPLISLYQAIRDVSGARVIVDSSKTMRYAALLASAPGVSVRLTNLIRDPRGIMFSRMQRARYRDGSLKPEARGYGRPRIFRILIKWAMRNALAARAMKRLGGTRLLYEDFTRSQHWYLEALLGEAGAQRVLQILENGPPPGFVQHQVAGNWVQDLRISTAERWRIELAPSLQRVMGQLSFPFRLHYRSRTYEPME